MIDEGNALVISGHLWSLYLLWMWCRGLAPWPWWRAPDPRISWATPRSTAFPSSGAKGTVQCNCSNCSDFQLASSNLKKECVNLSTLSQHCSKIQPFSSFLCKALQAGTVVIFDSRKVWQLGYTAAAAAKPGPTWSNIQEKVDRPFVSCAWAFCCQHPRRHAVAPSLRGDRWAMTLWVH